MQRVGFGVSRDQPSSLEGSASCPPGEAAVAPAGEPRAAIPHVDRVLAGLRARGIPVPPRLLLPQIRAALAAMRDGQRPVADAATLVDELTAAVAAVPRLQRVINATGVLLHTNLGRAPFGAAMLEAMAARVTGYSTLEFDLQRGERGSRTAAIEHRLREHFGVEGALAVNNTAAAVMLALRALAAGGEVLVSRGELVQIGGGFRVPEIMAESGAVLREVGTTNQTQAADFAGAVGESTRALLKVHASNFRQVGFVAVPTVAELAGVARQHGVPLLHDLGSGAVIDTRSWGYSPEPTVQQSLKAGADLVMFSGDKLLGSAQAGIVLGRAALIDRLRRHPLYRAVRLGKLDLAMLEVTLDALIDGRWSQFSGLARLAGASRATLERRCGAVASRLAPWPVERCEVASALGGGSLPGETCSDPGLALPVADPPRLARRLLAATPPVVVRVTGDAVQLNLRSVLPDDDAGLVAALATIAAAEPALAAGRRGVAPRRPAGATRGHRPARPGARSGAMTEPRR